MFNKCMSYKMDPVGMAMFDNDLIRNVRDTIGRHQREKEAAQKIIQQMKTKLDTALGPLQAVAALAQQVQSQKRVLNQRTRDWEGAMRNLTQANLELKRRWRSVNRIGHSEQLKICAEVKGKEQLANHLRKEAIARMHKLEQSLDEALHRYKEQKL